MKPCVLTCLVAISRFAQRSKKSTNTHPQLPSSRRRYDRDNNRQPKPRQYRARQSDHRWHRTGPSHRGEACTRQGLLGPSVQPSSHNLRARDSIPPLTVTIGAIAFNCFSAVQRLSRSRRRPTKHCYKKLSCRRETARCSVSPEMSKK